MHALVLSGGGARGAFQVGVLEAIIKRYPDYDPKILTGTSVGALNVSWLAQFPLGQFQAGVASLKSLWLSLTGNASIYESWVWGLGLAGAFLGKRPSLYTQRGLKKLVYWQLNQKRIVMSHRAVSVCAVSLKTGKTRFWNGADDHFIDAVLASSAFPVFFEPIRIGDELWTDGGVREIIPLDRAFEMGAATADVVSCSPREAFACPAAPNVLQVGYAVLDGMSNEIVADDLERQTRWLFEPEFILLEDSLDFDPAKIRVNIQYGYDHAMERLR